MSEFNLTFPSSEEKLVSDLISSKFKARVNNLESEMLKQPQVACPVVHRFGPGVYMREVSLPKDSIIVGHHQNFEHMNIFIKGHITFFGENGPVEMRAPMSFVGKPGRKIAFIHEDSIWLNVYSTTETDVEKLEAHFLSKSEHFVLDQKTRNELMLLESHAEKEDFESLLKEMELDPKVVRSISENTEDMIELPYDNYKIKTGPSRIEGKGLFATADIEAGEVLAPARINGKRTIAGRFTNHSKNPNAKMVQVGGDDISLVAMRNISGCHGGQDGEEITIDYREAIKLTREMGAKACQA